MVEGDLLRLELQPKNSLLQAIAFIFPRVQFVKCVLPIPLARIQSCGIHHSSHRFLTPLLSILLRSFLESRDDLIVLLLSHLGLLLFLFDLLSQEMDLLVKDGLLLGLLVATNVTSRNRLLHNLILVTISGSVVDTRGYWTDHTTVMHRNVVKITLLLRSRGLLRNMLN